MATNEPKDASLITPPSLMVRLMCRGTVSILEAVAEELPDVFAAEILPKLEIKGPPEVWGGRERGYALPKWLQNFARGC